MSSIKSAARHGVLLAVETTAYASGTPTPAVATDEFLVIEAPVPVTAYTQDGTRKGKSAMGFAELLRAPATGRAATTKLMHQFRGNPTAYSATVEPSVLRVLRAMGFSATFSATPTPQWTLVPTSATGSWTSLVGSVYSHDQLWSLSGGYVTDIEIMADGLVVPDWNVTLKAIQTALVSDVSVPAITYSRLSQMPPKATGLALTINGVTLKVVKHALKMQRTVTERTNQNNAGGTHGGFALSDLKATLDVTVEAPALATFNPQSLFEAGTVFATSLTVGTQAQNRYAISSNTNQIRTQPVDGVNGPVAQWDLSIGYYPTSDAGDIDLTFLIN